MLLLSRSTGQPRVRFLIPMAQSTIPYWIQRADFSVQDYTAESEQEALQVLLSHDWNVELDFHRQLKSEGEEVCDPGIGFLADPQRILHICPVDLFYAYFHYHYTVKTRVLGIFLCHRDLIGSNMKVRRSELTEILQRFLSGDHHWLLQKTWDAEQFEQWERSRG